MYSSNKSDKKEGMDFAFDVAFATAISMMDNPDPAYMSLRNPDIYQIKVEQMRSFINLLKEVRKLPENDLKQIVESHRAERNTKSV